MSLRMQSLNFPVLLAANLNIKFYTKTRLYAKNNHTFYNVTGCRGQCWANDLVFSDSILNGWSEVSE